MTKRRSIVHAGLAGVAAAAAVLAACGAAYADPPPTQPGAWPELRNVGTQLCMQASGTAAGSVVRVAACSQSPAEQWEVDLPTAAGAPVHIFSAAAPLCLQVTAASTADYARVELDSCPDNGYPDPNQQWTETAMGDGSVSYVNRNSGKCLTVHQFLFVPPAGGTGYWVRTLGQFSCDPNSLNQRWTMSWS